MNRVVYSADAKRRMLDHAFEEAQVGRHAADAELAQRAVACARSLPRRRRPRVTFTSSES